MDLSARTRTQPEPSFVLPDTLNAYPSHRPPNPPDTWGPVLYSVSEGIGRMGIENARNVTSDGPVVLPSHLTPMFSSFDPPPKMPVRARLSSRTVTLIAIVMCLLLAVACGLAGILWL